MTIADTNFWRKCSSCKNQINYNSIYWNCSVSTCNTKRAGMVFCSIQCWDVHLPIMNHREAHCEQKKSPASFQAAQQLELDKKRNSNIKQDSSSSKSEVNQTRNAIVIRKKPSS